MVRSYNKHKKKHRTRKSLSAHSISHLIEFVHNGNYALKEPEIAIYEDHMADWRNRYTNDLSIAKIRNDHIEGE